MLNLSLPIIINTDPVVAEADDIISATDFLNNYIIMDSINMTEHDNAYYCNILGGSIAIELNDTLFTAYLLSVDYITLSFDNTEVKLEPNKLYTLSYFIENNSTYILVNGIQHKLLRHSITVSYISYGAFGNIKIVNHTTYHDKALTVPLGDVHCIASGTASIIEDTIYFYPESLAEYSDTISQFIIIDKDNRLAYYTLTNRCCTEKSKEINTDSFTVENDYTISNIDSPSTDSPAEIIGNNIKFHVSGEYRITLTKEFYLTVINLVVVLPDIDIDPIPPEPDLPPDDNENESPDDGDENESPDDETPDEVEPPVPPDNNTDSPPDTDGNTDPDNQPAEELLPPSGDTSDSAVLPDFNINYERQLDYVKVIIVAVCVAFAIGGTVTISIVLSQIKKRKKKISN